MTNLTAKACKLAGILAVPAWRAALRRHRVAAGVEHARVLRNLGPVRTVVDIGANRGQFALVARHCFPEARVVSFEPLPGPAALWQAVFKGDEQASLIEAAVGPDAGEAQIHVSARDDSSSLLPITARQNALFPGTAESGTATIRVMRLADRISPIMKPEMPRSTPMTGRIGNTAPPPTPPRNAMAAMPQLRRAML